MTQDELDAIPTTDSFGQTVEIIDGKEIRRPKFFTVGALFQGPTDIMLMEDRYGLTWTTGWANGVLYKRRMRI